MGRKDVITKEYMEDTEVLEHFTSNFREVMQFIKYSKEFEGTGYGECNYSIWS